ncbi:unnamed protein product [Somion occarium]|uniref:Uncharacterized protein n=1 Tax=Somion occarium TaxID=3059160 RepID=A0ABP1E447_9APHY
MKWTSALFIVVALTSMSSAALMPDWLDQFFMSLAPAAKDDRCSSQKNPNGTGKCSPCVALQDKGKYICAFDRNTLDCVSRPSGKLPDNLVGNENAAQCTTLQQISMETPRFTSTELQRARTGWNRMETHVLDGEPNDPKAGRHLFTSWRLKNNDQGNCDDDTNLCAFNGGLKTVWNDCQAARYTRKDVQDICTGSILFNIRHNRMASSRNSVIKSKSGKSLCIEHLVTASNTPSCFPIGFHYTTAPVDSSRACTPAQQGQGPVRLVPQGQGC